MFSWLKKHFIPHEGNEHRPHILRSYSTNSIIIFIIFIEIISFLVPTFSRLNTNGGMAAVLPSVLADLTNSERQADDLSTLTVNLLLNKAAEMKAEDMAAKGYFAHTSPEGKTPWYWLEQVGYQYQYAGENLAINFSDSKDVTAAWMASPTHKANIVKENYTEIGTGVATGMYQGQETVFVAQVYANPLPKVFQAAVVPKPTTPAIEKVAIAKTELGKVLGAEVTAQVGSMMNNIETKPYIRPSLWQNIMASPRNTTNVFLYVILGVIFIALLLYIIIKMRSHHHDLLSNGLLIIVVIGAVLAINYYWSHDNMMVTNSFDYSNISK